MINNANSITIIASLHAKIKFVHCNGPALQKPATSIVNAKMMHYVEFEGKHKMHALFTCLK